MSIQAHLEEFNDSFYTNDYNTQTTLFNLLQSHISEKGSYSKEILQNREFRKLSEDIQAYNCCMALLHNTEWVTILNSHNILVESRGTPSSFRTKASLLVESDLFTVLSIICEPDLTPNW